MSSFDNTIDETVSEIIFSKNQPCLILEGSSDKLFWEHVLRNNKENFIFLLVNDRTGNDNKSTVIEIIKKCDTLEHKTIGIVDLDYDADLNLKKELTKLYYYNANSLETFLLLQKDHTVNVINNLCRTNKDIKDIDDILNKVFNASLPLSQLRYINLAEQLDKKHPCNTIKKEKIINKKTLKRYSVDSIVKYLQSFWHVNEKEIEVIKKELNNPPSEFNSFFYHGHDSFHFFKEIIQKKSSSNLDEDIIFSLYCSYFNEYAKDFNVPSDLINNIIIK